MFKKILIANRGEIACRIIRTAKEMGIQTVSVYSDADADGLHVRLADEAVHIGPAASAESYLRADKIIAAAKATGAEAIHPGFGFLSENADFAAQLDEAGIEFVGPRVRAIRAMGDKIESKKLAAKAGVNTVPGHAESLRDADQALSIARDIGFPVMLKASAGGGGKGMRIAWREDEVIDGFNLAASEARTSFGDDRIFVEKFIEQPRHIEIQLIADRHGNVVYLGERECSIQRRHQKVIEEAPSPFVDESLRRAMGEQAVALASAVDYESAGTVEFIVDKDRNFYFLEMNTRLQVEHPVTEYITGLDLVELMFRVASGEALPFSQSDIRLNGWAIESRVYAEDPERGFLPSTGRLVRYQPPKVTDSVRLDSGVEEGSEISIYYDPMIAKLVTHGASRDEAIDAMIDALDSYTVRGLSNNIEFLCAVCRHPTFRSGNLSTAFIDTYYPDGFDPQASEIELRHQLVAAAVFAERARETRGRGPGGAELMDYVAFVGVPDAVEVPVVLKPRGTGFDVEVDGMTETYEPTWRVGDDTMRLKSAGRDFYVQVDTVGRRAWRVSRGGAQLTTRVFAPNVAALQRLMPIKRPPDMSKFLVSPMPGLLVRVSVDVGETVKAGQELAVVEAMKMENVLHASQDGVIAAIVAEAGASLSVEQPILEFESSPE
ncbi:MAG: acetyl/propionyl/methylcrotonyl-CoA carboxylase subunit alpha [Pseudomonadota bacterium]